MFTLLPMLLMQLGHATPQTPTEIVHQYVKREGIFVPYYFEGEMRPAAAHRLYISSSHVSLNEVVIGNQLTDAAVRTQLQELKGPILLFVPLTTSFDAFQQILQHTPTDALYLAIQEPCGIPAALSLTNLLTTDAPHHQIFVGANQLEFCQAGHNLNSFNDCDIENSGAHMCDKLRQSFISSLSLSDVDKESGIAIQIEQTHAQSYTLQNLLQTIWQLQNPHQLHIKLMSTKGTSCQM